MASYPYITNTGTIKRFFDHVQNLGIPDKVNQKYLPSVGFSSSNDRPIIPIAKHLGFLDSSSTPTVLWRDYRDRSAARALMAKALREAYPDLYKSYPEAHSVNDGLVQNFISANSSLSSTTAGLAVRTFKILCELADFGSISQSPTVVEDLTEGRSDSELTKPEILRKPANNYPDVHIDVQIHIDSTASPEQIDQVFASMARHLYQRDES